MCISNNNANTRTKDEMGTKAGSLARDKLSFVNRRPLLQTPASARGNSSYLAKKREISSPVSASPASRSTTGWVREIIEL